ncbi:MAG TPA: ATP-binding cassette domain-containing protein [bacterium]|nr:ATP-binding cassette domain-containing protein [bacterium]HPN34437.1 ATP-binding cassette domain-containing protein [bacterium]
MSSVQLIFHDVTFTYAASPAELFKAVSFHAGAGWTGVIGANGSGKSTLLKLAAGLLQPDSGSISRPVLCLYCPQRTDDPPERAVEFIKDENRESRLLKEKLEISDDFLMRWQTLSHGERKRLQLAVALRFNPDLLAVDEPTNHLDAQARDLIVAGLQTFRGIGLLVSHDRELLDRLCQTCLLASPPAILARPGGATLALAAVEQEQEAVQRQYDLNKHLLKKVRQEADRRRREAQAADRKRSKRHLERKDRDGRAKIDRARLTGKDGQAGRLQRQLRSRLEKMEAGLAEIKPEKSFELGIWLPSSRSQRDFLLSLPAADLDLGGNKKLCCPDLLIRPTDRIAITGPNGSGKSTLVRHLLGRLHADEDRITYLPQEIDGQTSRTILQKAQSLSGPQLGRVMNIVSRLGSRPQRLLASAEPSPGEIRKLILALGMAREPHIIIMDEPTNHLDLPSIQCLEQALADCPCAMMLVSHDLYFLRQLTFSAWHLTSTRTKEEYVLKTSHLS